MKLKEQPIFLVGSIRSGTTLIRLMLDCHPDLAFNLESEFLVSQISDDNTLPDMQGYLEWLQRDRVFQHSNFSINKELDYVSLMNDFLDQKKQRDGKRIVGATVHENFNKLPRVWPKAKYVHIYRDGRDVANSVMRMGLAGNTYMASDWWIKAEQEWNDLSSTLPPGSYIDVCYEDFICDAKGTLKDVCDFIGVSYDEHMFDYVNNSTYGLPNPQLTYQWKKKPITNSLFCLESKISSMLVQRGYEINLNKPLRIGWLKKHYLSFNSKVNRLLFRIKKYSLILILQEMVSRRLGFTRWNIFIVGKINQITNDNLD